MIAENTNLISVIVPLYNKEAWIDRCIRSVLNQTYDNIEILVVNDGSTDESRSVVAAIDDPRVRIIDKPNGGLSSARNRGIEEAKGEYIALLDADDEWEIQHLEVLLKGFSRSDNVVLVCSDLMETADGEKENGIKRKLPFQFPQDGQIHYRVIEDYIDTLNKGYFLLSGSSVLIKKEIIEANKMLFYKASEPSEDINYWLRLNQLGKFVFCDYIGLFYHRVDSNSIMNKKTKEAKLVPPFFYDVQFDQYSQKDKQSIQKFLFVEYLKKAYQNRGLPLRKEELSTNIGGGIEIGWYRSAVYLLIRFAPQWVFIVKKYISSFKRKVIR